MRIIPLASAVGFQSSILGRLQTFPLRNQDGESAIELLTANAADYPTSASAEFGVGRAYKASGDFQNARIHFQKALEIDPNFRKASDGLNALK